MKSRKMPVLYRGGAGPKG